MYDPFLRFARFKNMGEGDGVVDIEGFDREEADIETVMMIQPCGIVANDIVRTDLVSSFPQCSHIHCTQEILLR